MDDRVRILHFVASFDVGGTERHVTNLLNAHDRDRFEVFVGALDKRGPLLADLGTMADGIVEFPIRRLYGPSTWAMQARAAAFLRARRIQVVNTYGFYANCFLVPAARLARVPAVVASIRDNRTVWTSRQRTVERWACRAADSVLTNAEACRDTLIAEGYAPDRITVIRNGIDVDRFRRPTARSSVRGDFDIPDDAPLVGTVARIDQCKGLEHFIDAAGAVSRSLPEARFVIVGGHASTHAGYRAQLEHRSRRAGLGERLVFAGNRNDVPALLAELDVSVLSSLTEGFPNAVLESMAAGVPTVATSVGGVPELITDGVEGLLVPPGDAGPLATAVERLLRRPDEGAAMARRARDLIEARFSRRRMAQSTEQHYAALLSANRNGSGRRRFRRRAPRLSACVRGPNES